MNVKKLRKLQKWILAEPKRFDMATWVSTALEKERKPSCGTVGCLAGMACHMEGYDIHSMSFTQIPRQACEILGLDMDQEVRLFYLDSLQILRFGGKNWPSKFDIAYFQAKTLKGRARVAVRRINHLIKTKGAE